DGRWVPTFPNAKYVFHKREYAAWEEATKRGETPPGNVWRYNCKPVVAAGQALLVDDDFQLDDTLWLTPTPGHSPCHCCVNIRSGGQRAVITGDLMHHALQCRRSLTGTVLRPLTHAGGFWARLPGQTPWCCQSIFRTRPPDGSRLTATGSITC